MNLYTNFEFYLYFETIGANTICQFTEDWKIKTGIPENVFALNNVKLIINTIDATSGTYTGSDINLEAGLAAAAPDIGKYPITFQVSKNIQF